jgi:hypothetical protein
MLNYQYLACQAGIKEKVVEMAINGSGICNGLHLKTVVLAFSAILGSN